MEIAVIGAGIAGLGAAYLLNRRHRVTVYDHLLPMAAAIWSCPLATMLELPALSFARFFHNHGLLSLTDRPRWHTAAGGSQRTGLYFALWGMATKLALALSVGLAFPLLDLAGFRAGQANDKPALLALALLYGGLPVLFKLGASALIWNFPLDAVVQSALRRRIEVGG
jgi:Na+/melibiose symporter-like transporter